MSNGLSISSIGDYTNQITLDDSGIIINVRDNDGNTLAPSLPSEPLTYNDQDLITKSYVNTNFEPGLNVPSNSGYILSSDINGNRQWISPNNVGNSAYNPSVSDNTEMQEDVGGIEAGTTAGELRGQSMSNIFDNMFFPTVQPSLQSTNSVNLVSNYTGTREVGASYTVDLAASFNRGQIINGDGSFGPTLVGNAYEYTFNGNVPSLPITQPGNVLQVAGITLEGSNNFSVISAYNEGTGEYYDSTGNESNIFDPLRGAGSSSDTSSSYNGVFPFFWGGNASDLTDGSIYGVLSKQILTKSDKSVNYNFSDEYGYFCYPSSYGDLTLILDANGFNVTSAFTKYTVNVNSVGLGTNWTEEYNIYRTNGITSIVGQTYQFKF